MLMLMPKPLQALILVSFFAVLMLLAASFVFYLQHRTNVIKGKRAEANTAKDTLTVME